MAYVFNSGAGGVICDQCRIMIDSGLSWKEYEESWNRNGQGDYCMRCMMHPSKAKKRSAGNGDNNTSPESH